MLMKKNICAQPAFLDEHFKREKLDVAMRCEKVTEETTHHGCLGLTAGYTIPARTIEQVDRGTSKLIIILSFLRFSFYAYNHSPLMTTGLTPQNSEEGKEIKVSGKGGILKQRQVAER